MVIPLRNLNCDYCREYKRSVQSLTDEAQSDDEIREIAARGGWTRKRNPGWPHRGEWDVCPACRADGTAERT